MPARVTRAATARGKRFFALEDEDRVEYHLMLNAARDSNGQFVGYSAWLRKHNELYLSEEDAVAAALSVVDAVRRMTYGDGPAYAAGPAGFGLVERASESSPRP